MVKTIGKILPNGVVIKEFHEQGFIYKNYEAFNNKTDEICYIPELNGLEGEEETIHNNTTYNYNKILKIAKGNEQLAQELFKIANWQHIETLHTEYEIKNKY